jgi:hypothetical protein
MSSIRSSTAKIDDGVYRAGGQTVEAAPTFGLRKPCSDSNAYHTQKCSLSCRRRDPARETNVIRILRSMTTILAQHEGMDDLRREPRSDVKNGTVLKIVLTFVANDRLLVQIAVEELNSTTNYPISQDHTLHLIST